MKQESRMINNKTMKQEFPMIKDDIKQLAMELYQSSKKDAEENIKEDIVNFKEAAKVLDLSPGTIYGKVYRGEIPHFRMGNKILFSRAILVKWLR